METFLYRTKIGALAVPRKDREIDYHSSREGIPSQLDFLKKYWILLVYLSQL